MARAEIRVEVVFCPRPGECDRRLIELPQGTTLDQALHASGVLARHGLAIDGLRKGVWCKVQAGDAVLRDGDRVELYRELTVDPKEARRLRYRGGRDRRRGA